MNELTREKILAMPAGRKLDRLVALNVMGFEPSKMEPKLVRKGVRAAVVEPYSTYISAAWEVEGHFNQDNEIRSNYMINLYVIVGLQPHLKPSLDDLYLIAHASAEQRCKASLLAVMGL